MFEQLMRAYRGIDALNEFIGKWIKWLILGSVLVSAGNATSRYALGMASNAWLELQWHFYAGCTCWQPPTHLSETSTYASI